MSSTEFSALPLSASVPNPSNWKLVLPADTVKPSAVSPLHAVPRQQSSPMPATCLDPLSSAVCSSERCSQLNCRLVCLSPGASSLQDSALPSTDPVRQLVEDVDDVVDCRAIIGGSQNLHSPPPPRRLPSLGVRYSQQAAAVSFPRGTAATIGVVAAAAALCCSEHPRIPRRLFQFTLFSFAAMALLFRRVWIGWGISCKSCDRSWRIIRETERRIKEENEPPKSRDLPAD